MNQIVKPKQFTLVRILNPLKITILNFVLHRNVVVLLFVHLAHIHHLFDRSSTQQSKHSHISCLSNSERSILCLQILRRIPMRFSNSQYHTYNTPPLLPPSSHPPSTYGQR
eukprot:TRINITY_DN22517_c0_g1_i1.p1 TRINITY_DN22517_c0_g1~~TRINITY_DN22517_c0_g1_i1.p1  ORF type:complete len:111 (+),score=1.69 TRINITY_DN22517_c0_g1_i1:101-433(+)